MCALLWYIMKLTTIFLAVIGNGDRDGRDGLLGRYIGDGVLTALDNAPYCYKHHQYYTQGK